MRQIVLTIISLLTCLTYATAQDYGNPYLPMWEHIPDGEPYVFDDPDCPGKLLNSEGLADVLFAPDVAVATDSNGKKTYYLYPNDQEWGRQQLIAKSSRPDGPFEVCNWSKEDPNKVDGILQFDPAVFVDDDGRVYGYWGFCRSYAAELDPQTMATVKLGTQIIEDMVSSKDQPGIFRFYEASSSFSSMVVIRSQRKRAAFSGRS